MSLGIVLLCVLVHRGAASGCKERQKTKGDCSRLHNLAACCNPSLTHYESTALTAELRARMGVNLAHLQWFSLPRLPIDAWPLWAWCHLGPPVAHRPRTGALRRPIGAREPDVRTGGSSAGSCCPMSISRRHIQTPLKDGCSAGDKSRSHARLLRAELFLLEP